MDSINEVNTGYTTYSSDDENRTKTPPPFRPEAPPNIKKEYAAAKIEGRPTPPQDLSNVIRKLIYP